MSQDKEDRISHRHHVGAIHHPDDNEFSGDGVNIAARIDGLPNEAALHFR